MLTPSLLIDFLNHGILPFTGRKDVVEHVLRFWQGTAEAPGLQALLLLGEAGMGKSRGVEEITGEIVRKHGAVVHTKLYPESATSLAPLVARALWRFADAHPLLKIEPARGTGDSPGDESLPAVIAAIRRLARLRQTLLIFEDIHLLNGDGISDFSFLLDALADEHIAILCLARPVELAARGLLERHLVDEIELSGLDRDAIADLWQALFGSRPSPETAELVRRATLGNPLAIRSALRGALKSRAIAQDAAGIWWITPSAAAFEESLMRSVRLLSEGMAAHLAEEERGAAQRIATLGEVLARETAVEMIDGGDQMIELLIFRGILVETGMLMPPLAGRGSSYPLLAFTHTLLHRQLAERASVEVDRIARAVIDGLPIYSIVPFQFLAAHAAGLGISPAAALLMLESIMEITLRLDNGPDWPLALDLFEATRRIADRFAGEWDERTRLVMELRVLDEQIMLIRRKDFSDEYRDVVERFLDRTAGELPADLLEYRLRALRSLYWTNFRHDPPANNELQKEIATFVALHPELKITSTYIDYMGKLARTAASEENRELAELVENEMDAILSSGLLTDQMRQLARLKISTQLLLVFATSEEVERRMRLLGELDAEFGARGDFLLMKITFLMNIGCIREMLEACEQATRIFRLGGQLRSEYYTRLTRLFGHAMTGFDLTTIGEEALAICDEAERVAARIRLHAATYFTMAGLLHGRPEWAREMALRLVKDISRLPWEVRFGIIIGGGDRDELLSACPTAERPFVEIAKLLLGDGDAEAAEQELGEVLRAPVFRLSNTLSLRMIIDLKEQAEGMAPARFSDRFRKKIGDAVATHLEWLAERRLSPIAAALLERGGGYLNGRERKEWERRIGEMTHHTPVEETTEEKIRLAMLGSIEIVRPAGEPNRPRGVRLRTMLGLMVADRMLDKPLSQRELCRLAASDAPEFEDARKTVNLAVHRLREILGHDAILTDAETPKLNLDLVDVDLLHAHRLLEETAVAVRDGSFPRAFTTLVKALEIAGGEVPFPTLYDDFFEAAREDFENRLRSTIIRVAKGLLHDGDALHAEQVLRHAFDAMPEDEDLGSLLADALVSLGKRTEAERVKRFTSLANARDDINKVLSRRLKPCD